VRISINDILTPSSFKIGCLLVLLSLGIYFSFGDQKPTLFKVLDNRLTDTMFHLRGPQPVTGQVVIIDIDNKSLAALGQWPWPRNVVARLIDALAAQQPAAILLDIVFAEPDRTSPERLIAALLPHTAGAQTRAELQALQNQQHFNHDLLLGEALARAPTVLGYAFSLNEGLTGHTEERQPFPACNIGLEGIGTSFTDLTLITAHSVILNTPDIAMAESEGFFNMFPDSSGTMRKVPLFMLYQGMPYPSLALEAFRIGTGEEKAVIHTAATNHASKIGILGVSVGRTFLPTDEKGQLSINYRGPFGSFAYVPAVDILNKTATLDLRGKHLIIGTSAEGLYDLRATPYASIIPGVEIQANVIDNMLAADPMVYDTFTEIGLTYTMLLAGGLLLTAILAYSTPLAGGIGGLLLIQAAFGVSYMFFLGNSIVGITFPLCTILVIFLSVTLFNFFFVGQEKRYLSDAFKRYVAPGVVQEVIRNPSSLALKGETKELTVFFSDIRGFTAISEHLSPEQLSQLMNEYLTAMSNLIMDHGGTVDKFIGDAIMAIWGAPLALADQELKAVRAALASVETLARLQPGWSAMGLPPIRIGIGINTGMMRVGNFGSEKRFDYTVLGDNVNLASRLEGLNKTYGTSILISERTMQAMAAAIPCCYIDMVRVKGKDLPVRIFEPLGPELAAAINPQLPRYEAALALYQQRDFQAAHSLFAALQKEYGRQLYEVYAERSAFFSQNPPTADWDGVFSFTTK
jgi:adenylate cyclase